MHNDQTYKIAITTSKCRACLRKGKSMKITIANDDRTLTVEQEIADYDDAKHVVVTILGWLTFSPYQIDDMFRQWGEEAVDDTQETD